MKSLNSRSLVLMASVILLIQGPESQASAPALIPQPARMEIGAGQFMLESQARVSVIPESKEGMAVGDYLAGHLRLATGFPLPVGTQSSCFFAWREMDTAGQRSPRGRNQVCRIFLPAACGTRMKSLNRSRKDREEVMVMLRGIPNCG
jgi:hypothetical protein